MTTTLNLFDDNETDDEQAMALEQFADNMATELMVARRTSQTNPYTKDLTLHALLAAVAGAALEMLEEEQRRAMAG